MHLSSVIAIEDLEYRILEAGVEIQQRKKLAELGSLVQFVRFNFIENLIESVNTFFANSDSSEPVVFTRIVHLADIENLLRSSTAHAMGN